HPSSRSRCTKEPTHWAATVDVVEPINPMVGFPGCCARAATGHAAAPPSSVMNSRRFNGANCIRPLPASAGLQDNELAIVSQWARRLFHNRPAVCQLAQNEEMCVLDDNSRKLSSAIAMRALGR